MSTENLPEAPPAPIQPPSMQIKNLCPGLMELGKIKIGRKGDSRQTKGGGTFQLPQKLDHFIVTTMERGQDNNFLPDEHIHQSIGDTPKEIPIRLLYDDPALNFPTRYACYEGRTLCCSGDGETAYVMQQGGTRRPVQCPCDRQSPTYKGKNKCKINGILSVMIDGAGVVGGVWKFRTTSYNTVVGILSSLALIRRITGGRLAGIPLTMTVTPKTVADPVKGSQQTIYVVGLRYVGSVSELQNEGYQIAMDEAKHGIRVEMIEDDARRMLTYEPVDGDPLGVDDAADIVDEYYPDEAIQAETPTLVAPPTPTAEPPVTQTRERGKPAHGRKRRTNAEIEEDRLADEADAQAAQGTQGTVDDSCTEPAEPAETETTEEPPPLAEPEPEPKPQVTEPLAVPGNKPINLF